jgi:hypothetical protein
VTEPHDPNADAPVFPDPDAWPLPGSAASYAGPPPAYAGPPSYGPPPGYAGPPPNYAGPPQFAAPPPDAYTPGRPPAFAGAAYQYPLSAELVIAPRTRRRLPWVVAALATAVIATVAVAAYAFPDHRKSIDLPLAAAGYSEIRSVDASTFAQLTGEANGAAELHDAKVGVYGIGSDRTPALIFIGVSAKNNATVRRQLDSDSSSEEVSEAFTGLGSADPATEDPGQLGGTMRCDEIEDAYSVCIWIDHSTLGMIFVLPPTADVSKVAETTREFRAAAEH